MKKHGDDSIGIIPGTDPSYPSRSINPGISPAVGGWDPGKDEDDDDDKGNSVFAFLYSLTTSRGICIY